jgi:hypothetical protein
MCTPTPIQPLQAGRIGGGSEVVQVPVRRADRSVTQPGGHRAQVHPTRQPEARRRVPQVVLVDPSPPVRRISVTTTATASLTCCGLDGGRWDRSASPATPSRRYSCSQACTLTRDTPTVAATSVTEAPANTARTASSRCSTLDKTAEPFPASRGSRRPRHRPQDRPITARC